jgi:uncharacterized protein (UPF0262 family)
MKTENPFKLDKTAFSKRKHGDEMAENRAFWLSKTPAERLNAAYHLICAAYNLDWRERNPMDKTAFSKRKHE